LIRTPDGLVPAGDIVVGDMLLSADIEGFPYDWYEGATSDAMNWEEPNPEIEIKETMVVALEHRVSEYAVVVNYDIFSETHYVLVKRDGLATFMDAKEIKMTDKIWSYENQNWEDIFLFEIVEAPHDVVCINTEPYDIFFTENMLVHDSHAIIDYDNLPQNQNNE